MTFNQRSIAQILQTVRIVGSLVGRTPEADALAASLSSRD